MVWSRRWRPPLSTVAMLLSLVAICVPMLTVTLYLFFESEDAEQELIRTDGQLTVDILTRRLRDYFHARFSALMEMKGFYENSTSVEPDEFRGFTNQLLSYWPEFSAITYCDPRLVVLHSAPDTPTQQRRVGTTLPENRAIPARQAIQRREAVMAAIPDGEGGLPAVHLYLPTLKNGKPDGLIEGILPAGSGFENLYGPEVLRYWDVEVRDDHNLLITGRRGGHDQQPPIATQQLTYGGGTWELRVWARPELSNIYQTPSPQRIVIFGWITTSLLACAAFLLYQRQIRLTRALREAHRLSMAMDATQRHLAEIVHGVNAVVYEAAAPDFRFTFISDAVEKLFGYPAEKWRAESGFFLRLMPAEDRKRFRDELDLHSRNREPFVIEVRLNAADKRILYVKNVVNTVQAADGSPAGWRGVLLDVTDRQLAEQALRESERRFREIMENVRLASLVHDAEGKVLFGNAQLLRLVDRPREQVIGGSIFDFVGPSPDFPPSPDTDLEKRRARFRQIIEADQLPEHLRTEIIRPDGSRRMVAWSTVCSRDAQGRIIAVTSLGEDITERNAEEEALRQAQKLESLGVLAGGVAHDFNNLLTVIMGNTELALSSHDITRQHGYLKKIENTTRRLADLTRQLLAYSGKGKLLAQPIDFNTVLRDITELIHVSVPKTLTINFDLEVDLPPILADSVQIEQVVLNLVLNAAEAIGEKPGTVTLRTMRKHVTAELIAATLKGQSLAPGRCVELCVQDNGCGMSPETMGRIFDPFFTTKFTGRGLGLAALQGIVRGHNGAIRIESELGQGTIFHLYFPALDASAMPAPSAKKIPKPSRASARLAPYSGVRLETPKPASTFTNDGKAETIAPASPTASDPARPEGAILVIDDEEPIRDLSGSALAQAGWEVMMAEDGAIGLEVFDRYRDRIALILLDMTMPRMGGQECCRRLLEVAPRLPVVVISGYSEQEVVSRFSGQPLAGFLQKPFTPSQLVAAVKAGLSKRQSPGAFEI